MLGKDFVLYKADTKFIERSSLTDSERNNSNKKENEIFRNKLPLQLFSVGY
jgi:hypothetical protein